MKNHNKAQGFTFLEILFSILVFSVGMLAYFNYQSRASAILFETESSHIATRLLVEIPEEINGMSEDLFRTVIEPLTLPTDWMSDVDFKNLSTFFRFPTGPFDSFGNPVTGENGFFHRKVRITTFNALTGSNHDENSPLEVIRVVEVLVSWPDRDHPAAQCTGGPGAVPGCHDLMVRSFKPIYYY